jgi:serine/alanine adding enzyme
MSKLEELKKPADINSQMTKLNGAQKANVFHAEQMANLKEAQNWQSYYLKFSEYGSDYIFLLLTKKVTFLGKIAYIARGPNLENKQMVSLLTKLKAWASGQNIFVIKIEPNIPSSEITKLKERFNLKPASRIQTNSSTIIIDLSPIEEDLINSFKQKTRYNIRLSERKGVRVDKVDASEENLETMFKMMQQMSVRSGASIKSKDYLFKYWRSFIDAGDGAIFFAKDETGQVLAGAFVQFLGGQALYKDGGSTREKSNLMAPYLLQWEIMKWLKLKGVIYYDMHGSTTSELQDDASHPYYNVTKFKQGFNKQITDWAGVWDLPIDGGKYNLWVKFGKFYLKLYYFSHNKQTFY